MLLSHFAMDSNDLTKLSNNHRFVTKDIFTLASVSQVQLPSLSTVVPENSYNSLCNNSATNAGNPFGYGMPNHLLNNQSQNSLQSLSINQGRSQQYQSQMDYNSNYMPQLGNNSNSNNGSSSSSSSSSSYHSSRSSNSACSSPYLLSSMPHSSLYGQELPFPLPHMPPSQSSTNQSLAANIHAQNIISGNSPLRFVEESKIEVMRATVDAAIAAAETSAAVDSGIVPRRRRKKTATDALPNAKTYPCDKCEKIFHRPYNLRSHMKSHSTEKPFACQFCGRRFTRGHDKKRHELLHKGSKKFKCGGFLKDGKTRWGCNKKFARADALGRHFRTESGWLCIKPLMAEAKASEEHNQLHGNKKGISHQPDVNFMAHQVAQAQMKMPTISSQQQPNYNMGYYGVNGQNTLNDIVSTRNIYSQINLNSYNDPNSTNDSAINDILKNVK